MKAVYINKFGDASNIIVGFLDKPVLKDNEVLVKTIATTINNVDTFIRKGLYPVNVKMPFLLGRDVVGEVINSNNSNFKNGDIVWSNSFGYENRNGVSAEILALDKERLYKLPENVDPYLAVSSLHALTTAVLLLTDLISTHKGKSILIQGARGLVGSKLVEVAKILKLDIYTTSNKLDFNYLEKHGATPFDYNNPNYNQKFDIIIDTSGKNKLNDNVKLLNDFGKLLIITKPLDANFDAWDLYTNSKQILGFVLSKQSLSKLNKAAHFINQHFEKGYFLNDDIEILSYKLIKEYHEKFDNNIKFNKRKVFIFD